MFFLVLSLTSLAAGGPWVSSFPADSTELHEAARSAQASFERYRVSRLPSTWDRGAGSCDEWVGRFCIRFGAETDDEDSPPGWTSPPDPPSVVERRTELIDQLREGAAAHPGDSWVMGQLVSYLVESGQREGALRAAESCEAVEPGWCLALEGYALYHLARIPDAEAAFDAMLEELDEEERGRWLDPEDLVDEDTRRRLSGMEGSDREALVSAIWRLSDPLLMIDGHELRAEHLARHTLARIRSDARNPHGIRWSDDMTRILVRYGPQAGYERVIERRIGVVLGPPPIIGRFSPEARRMIPSDPVFEDFQSAGPADFDTRNRRARSRHEPVTSPRIGRMEVQLARFREGDSLRVVGGLRLVPLPEQEEAEPEASDRNGTHLQVGLHALLQDGMGDHMEAGRVHVPQADSDSGWLDGRLPQGSHLVSIEALDPETRDAWRGRQAIQMEPRPRGIAQLSDLLLLHVEGEPAGLDLTAEGLDEFDGSGAQPVSLAESGAPLTLDDVLPRARAVTAVPAGPVEIAWEIYGLEPGETSWGLSVTVRPAERGRLWRFGEWLGVASAPSELSIEWEEGADLPPGGRAGEAAPVFRTVVLDLERLEPGRWELEVALALPGRSLARSTRMIEVTPSVAR